VLFKFVPISWCNHELQEKILHLCVCKAAVDPPTQIKLTKTHMLLQQKLQQQQLLQPHLISSSSSSAAELYLQKTANMQSSAGLKHDRKLNHKPGLQRERERERERREALHYTKERQREGNRRGKGKGRIEE
jgi:hypothetical protein